jgi:hypothetical protein
MDFLSWPDSLPVNRSNAVEGFLSTVPTSVPADGRVVGELITASGGKPGAGGEAIPVRFKAEDAQTSATLIDFSLNTLSLADPKARKVTTLQAI